MNRDSAIESASAAAVFWKFMVGIGLCILAVLELPGATDARPQAVLFVAGLVLVVWGWKSVRNPHLAMRYYLRRATTVAELIEDWNPEAARLESDYEHSLHMFLTSKLPFVKVTRQYGAARVKCDIAVGSDVYIEMKKGLRSTSKLQRLIGQMELYNNEWPGKPIILVLLGDSDYDLLHDLQRSASKYSDIRILTKEVAEPAHTGERSRS